MSIFLVHLQALLTLLGAQILRTGAFADENWMMAPPWLIRRVSQAVKVARAGLTQAAVARARALYAGGKVVRLRNPQRVRPSTVRPRSSSEDVAIRIRLRPANPTRPFVKPFPQISEPRGIRMKKLRGRIGALTTIAYESPAAHQHRIDRLARGIIKQLSRPPPTQAQRDARAAKQVLRAFGVAMSDDPYDCDRRSVSAGEPLPPKIRDG